MLIWLGLYPGLHRRYWTINYRFAKYEPVPFILSAFYSQIAKINLAKSKNLAATIIFNTMRSAVSDARNTIGHAKDIYRKRHATATWGVSGKRAKIYSKRLSDGSLG